ncbi:PucR family transcriptional regulator [Kribbella antibiotica]|uniref:PucR family transcriptional regulator n=1 Tax=Kribbella antibiotica TaxID=190195 RepID=A0A4R4YYX9_9ACTN|nr:helix-turn-helix domain-containing protein [Kribbella antibiotica]TDD50210.1 PucR family transcriptional regulator [Kribbella antibiotica]
MTQRPRASLGRVLDDLGATLLELVAGDPDQPIGGVVIHDPLDDPLLPQHALVLGVGLRDPDEITRVLRDLGRQQATGLVLRSPVPRGGQITAVAAATGVAVLGLTQGATWDQLGILLRSVLDVGVAESETLAGMPSGDLFALANATAALLDAPVTIEDRSSRVLAFSGRQDEADTARVETVLGRQVPDRYSRLLSERGVFRELYRTDQPVYVAPMPATEPEVALPRVAVAVRAGDEILGSIWVAVHEPLSEERSEALRDAAKVVALHMLRIRADADVERRLRADLVRTALDGTRDALDRLGLADQTLVVLGLAVPAATERQRLADAFAMHLGAVQPRAVAALVGDVTYGLVPVVSEERAAQIAQDFLDRVGDRSGATIGVATAVRLPQARASADRALRVLRTGRRTQRVARLADVQVEALLLELRDLVEARGEQPTGPIARLVAYDRDHSSTLVETLRAWLDAFGDVTAAAAAVYVHPNTFRYRLRRLAEIGSLDLSDPEARFAAMLQLRVLAADTVSGGSLDEPC